MLYILSAYRLFVLVFIEQLAPSHICGSRAPKMRIHGRGIPCKLRYHAFRSTGTTAAPGLRCPGSSTIVAPFSAVRASEPFRCEHDRLDRARLANWRSVSQGRSQALHPESSAPWQPDWSIGSSHTFLRVGLGGSNGNCPGDARPPRPARAKVRLFRASLHDGGVQAILR